MTLLFALGVGGPATLAAAPRGVSPITRSAPADAPGLPPDAMARGVRVQRQALVTYVYEPGGAFTVTVLDASGANPLAVDKLTLSAISEDNGTPIRAELHAVSDNVYTGDLGVSDGAYNLDLRAERAGKPLTGEHLISIRGVRDVGVIALTEPNTAEISRFTLLISLALGAPLALALAALVWGVLQNRRRELTEAPLDLPAPSRAP